MSRPEFEPGLSPEEKAKRLAAEGRWREVEIRYEPGDPRKETVLVTRVGPTRLRLLETPGYVVGVAAGDLVDLDAEDAVREVVERAGFLAVRFVVDDPADVGGAREVLDASLGPLGGWYEGQMALRGLRYSVPVTAGFDPIEEAIAAGLEAYPTSTWWYGNVYDAEDKPLDWCRAAREG